MPTIIDHHMATLNARMYILNASDIYEILEFREVDLSDAEWRKASLIRLCICVCVCACVF